MLLTYGGHSYWTGFADDSEVSARVVLSVAYAGRMSGRVDWEDTLETRLLADKPKFNGLKQILLWEKDLGDRILPCGTTFCAQPLSIATRRPSS